MKRFATVGFVAMGLGVVAACGGVLAPSEPSPPADSAAPENDPAGAAKNGGPTAPLSGASEAVDAASAAAAADASDAATAAATDAAATDANQDADAARFCDTSATTQPFAPSTTVLGLEHQLNMPPMTEVRLTPDELHAVYTRYAGAGGGAYLSEVTRASVADAFSGSRSMDFGWGAKYGTFAPDGLSIQFVAGYKHSDQGDPGMFTAQRADVSLPFEPRSPILPGVSGTDTYYAPYVVGTDVWFSRLGSPDFDIFHVSLVPGAGPPVPESGLNVVGEHDVDPVVSADGLTVFFARGKVLPEGPVFVPQLRIMEAHRATLDAPFAIREVCELNTTGDEHPTWLSPDGCRLYFTEGRFSIRVASRCAP